VDHWALGCAGRPVSRCASLRVKMLIKRFEDIEVWKEARRLVNMVYDLTDKSLFKKDAQILNRK
jgi:hypothetical protein